MRIPLLLALSACAALAEDLPISLYEHLKQPGRRVLALDGVAQPGRSYQVNDKLGEPQEFVFAASNTLGVFEIGDHVPLYSTTKLALHVAGENQLKLVCDGVTVAETSGPRLDYTVKAPAACRAQVYRGDQLWIDTEPIHVQRPTPDTLRLPSSQLDPTVEAIRDLPYAGDDLAKHKLDIFRQKAASPKAPVFVFIHGGSWRNGDRSQYPALGNRFAKAGAIVVIPSYRLAPAHLHPAQAEDAAAALAWTVKNIAQYGGDPQRIYLGGHSAGGHLVALIALDPRYLAKHELEPSLLKGVIAMSGVYDVRNLENVFGKDPTQWPGASPQTYVHAKAPPFTVTYCQWDYATLPAQARQFHAALRRAGARSELVYVPAQNHISELINIVADADLTAQSVFKLIGLPAAPTPPPQSGGSK